MDKKIFIFVLLFASAAAFAFYPKQKINNSNNLQTIKENPAVSVFVKNLKTPWELVFLPNGRMLVTERQGNLKALDKDGRLEQTIKVEGVKEYGEGGLLGMALSPNFEQNHFIYLYYTYSSNGENTLNKVVRFNFERDGLKDEKTIVDKIPGAVFHNGGRIKFGPDNYLYVTTGDAGNSSQAQNRLSLAGKILRVKDDGTNMEVYSYGHRNPQGLAWDNLNRLWETEHGPSAGVFPNCCQDEINLIRQNGNYGWPDSVGDKVQTGTIKPVLHSGTNTWAPSGTAIYKNKLYFAGLKGEALYEFDISANELKTHFKNEFGRIRDVVVHNNLLYILTNNTDGRGSLGEDDDKIIIVNLKKL